MARIVLHDRPQANLPELMIKVVQLIKDFGSHRVLNGLTFEVPEGEALFVLGPSGAGKSTLLRCLNGLFWPTSGQVLIDGTALARKNLATVRQRVGFIFQNYQLISNLSVLRNVLIGRLAEKGPWSLVFTKRDHRLALEAIDAVGLSDKVHARASTLSGGQMQRVGIARALAHDPEVLLVDEPISNLDPVSGREILALLRRINRERGTTLICNLHDVGLAIETADRILGLRSGSILFDRRPAELGHDDLGRLYEASVPASRSMGSDRLVSDSGGPIPPVKTPTSLWTTREAPR